MKHDLSNKANFKKTNNLTKSIIEITHSKFNTDDIQLQTMVHTLISNSEFNRVQKELENERFNTLITLARTLDDINLSKCINALNYSIIIPK